MRASKRFVLSAVVLVSVVTLVWALPFLTLQPGFTQELWATDPAFMGGVAFAPDGDVWVTPCAGGGGSLRRFDAQTTVTTNGTQVHPLIADVPSNAGCGLTNHPDGFLYSNTFSGVTRQDASTGAAAGGPFGPGGNALGIAVHPLTMELVYTGGSNGPIFAIDNAFTTSRTFSMATVGSFVDGIFFDPTGQFLFTATRTGGFRVTIIDATTGLLVQNVPLPSEPDGIAFHASSPKFVVTNNTDGTMSRLDFPSDDFTQPPVVSQFASGGFRGDLSQVGSDGCLYLTQNGTRFDDGSTSGANSIVRVCPGFAPAPGVSSIVLSPMHATNDVGTSHTVTAHVEVDNVPQTGVLVAFDVLSGPHAGLMGTDTTDAVGDATFTYTGTTVGLDTLQASFSDANGLHVSNPVTKEWVQGACVTLNFQVEDDFATPLVNGQHIDTEFGLLVSLSSSGVNAGLGIFDSTAGGPNDPSQDLDLLIDTGNLLILQTENFPPDGNDVFPRPNDDSDGGTLRFDFPSEVMASSVRLVDADVSGSSNHVVLTDSSGLRRTYAVPSGWTGDRTLAQPGQGTLDLMTLAPQPGFASVATATEDPGFDSHAVVRLEIQLASSGGVDDVTWCPSGAQALRAGVSIRNGSGVNPTNLRSWSRPVIGGTWVAGLDCSGHANGFAGLVVHTSPAAGFMTPFGELLVSGPRIAQPTRAHVGAATFFSAAIPNNVALIGRSVSVQGYCTGAPGPRLSNAVDVVAGY